MWIYRLPVISYTDIKAHSYVLYRILHTWAFGRGQTLRYRVSARPGWMARVGACMEAALATGPLGLS